MKPNKPANAYAKARHSATALLKDTLHLADLQFQLFSVDAAEFWKRAKVGIVCGVGASVITLGSVILLMFSLSEFLESSFELSQEFAKAIVASITLLVGGGVLAVCFRQLTKAGSALKRSQTELQENLIWLRSVLSHDEEQ
ncbi:phage holin family protein [Planctomicrobium piriforme]|uniref:Putative Holin-X, holin superfamily III n=1 Tax=Planctomicrobium piriforme TaxID=1576369 RepID=A0A1I3KW96_9PLAN|nr:phage holin family protein [Planctomicrobium piriforme]SFI76763.1 Putative Holin-X, holin superfamily III [Planctomicrobium piriforme]